MNRRQTLLFAACFLFCFKPAQAVLSPSRVLIVYQTNGPDTNQNGIVDSFELAQYYALKRGVPLTNMVGVAITGQYTALYGYYQNSEYPKFISEFVSPIKAKLAALGPTNIDVILLVGNLPRVLLNSSNIGYSIDNWLMGLNYWDTTTNNITEQDNPYFAATPSFQTDIPHFDHSVFKFNGTDMYLVSRLGAHNSFSTSGSDELKAMDRIDAGLYAEHYLSTQPGPQSYTGIGYVDSMTGQPNNSKWTDATLAASPDLQTPDWASSGNIDVNIAYGEHFVTAAGFPLKWENTITIGNSVSIGQAGAAWSDETLGADTAAPRAIFYGGWYNFDRYYDVWDWLPGSVACDLNSATYFAMEALSKGVSAASYVISEPISSTFNNQLRHQHPNTLLYYILKGYPYAEASTLATPDIGWVETNEGDPLYAPTAPHTPVADTQLPVLSTNFPTVTQSDPYNHPGNWQINLVVNQTPQPDLVQVTAVYGLDTNYGSSATSGEGYWSRPTVALPSLQANTLYHYKLTLKDPVGNITTTSDLTFNTTVAVTNPPVITNSGSVQGTVGTVLNYQITATNGPQSFSAAPLPAGLSLKSTTGLISGTPTAVGTTNVLLSASNSAGSSASVPITFTMSSAGSQPPTITSASSAQGTVGVLFTYSIGATNSPTSYSASPLPAGLAINTATGLISGSPSASGTTNASLVATNAAGASNPLTLVITINPPPTQAPVITSPLTAQAVVDVPFSYQITATNSPLTYSVNSLPPGVLLNFGTGFLSGTPSVAGVFDVPLTATNAIGISDPAILVFTVSSSSGGLSNGGNSPPTIVNSDISQVKVYPNPWRSDKHAGKSITFANLPSGSTIKLFTVSGHKVKELGPVSGNILWDLTNDSGAKVGSGIYMYLITDGAGNKVKGKVAVIK